MNLAGVDLNQLRALDALLSTRSVTAAARRLGVTQAAASNALRRLREQFGDALLVRAGQHMTLTPRARALTGPASEVMRAVAAVLATETRFDPSTLQATVPITTSDHVDLVLLSRVEAVLSKDAPGIDLHVLPFNLGFADELRQGKVELAISPLHERAPDLTSELLFRDPFVWVMRADHPARALRGSAKTFAGLRHLLVSPRGLSGGPIDAALARRGLARRVSRTMPSFGAALLLLSRSDLVAALPQRLVEEVGPELGLIWRPLPVAVPPVRIYAISHRRTDGDAKHAYVREIVRRAAAELATQPATSRARRSTGTGAT
jgi:DNA-binding transcriptional LysR family regulator